MKPLQQGELDDLCGMYAVINTVRACCGPSVSLGMLFRRLVRDAGAKLPDIAAGGSDADDIERYLRVALAMLWRKYRMALMFNHVEFASLKAMKAGLVEHLAKPNTAALIGVDDHYTVVVSMDGDLWELRDSNGYKYLHCSAGKMRRKKPILHAMPERVVFMVSVNRSP